MLLLRFKLNIEMKISYDTAKVLLAAKMVSKRTHKKDVYYPASNI